ncbi:acetamidase/formamidase family protein [Paraburkholderia sp. CNPSo 3274]|uniref:acetamidase/formamidase family protein n=1 Tax=Paraburkholderia sp. CNPSo 3274 TaxID=2940932 RepID=UPI0020B7A42E|nr:acetamidase/formamidase family protein [Paraburkholderia sp. CNPSo 3274]MCP3713086.1 acetamidase/formamidase family protein [Paraburkholderia sp. CNPSo 3274]
MLLADKFPDPALHIWKYEADLKIPAMYGPGGRVPLKPFCGTIGLAPGEPGLHSVIPPRRVGGNMDIRDIGAGTELCLPVEVEGALFSVGDTHAAQGDGEVCGTAIESPVALTAKFDGMIDILMRQHHISAIDAYLLCSVCAYLRISEIVDRPNWIVSLYFPRIVFE